MCNTTSAPPPPPPPQGVSVQKCCTPVATLARTCFCESKPWRVASLMMAERGDAAGVTSSARRRRERRLRSWAKHERLSVAVALAEKLHHSPNRTALPKEEEVEQDYALRGQKPATAGSARSFLFVGGVSVGASGRASAAGSGSAAHLGAEDRARRLTCRSSTIPCLPCRRRRASCLMCSGPSTARLPSRLSKCPGCLSCPSRSPCLEPQMAEQLVDVPTVLSYALLQQRNVEQIVDIPVLLGRGRRRLRDSVPRQGSTASGAEQIADSLFGGGLHGFLPGLVPAASGVEQLVYSSSGGLQGFFSRT